MSLLLVGIFAASLLLAKSFLSKASIYKLFVLPINFIKSNTASGLALKKSFILYKVLCKIIQCVISYYNLHVERYIIIFQVVIHIFEEYLYFMLAMLKNFLLLIFEKVY